VIGRPARRRRCGRIGSLRSLRRRVEELGSPVATDRIAPWRTSVEGTAIAELIEARRMSIAATGALPRRRVCRAMREP
jgi:hypothetical protein